MKTKTRRSPARRHALHFHEWVKKNYPKKTPTRKFLQIIGALDLMYLFYRLQIKLQGTAKRAALRKDMEKPAVKAGPVAVIEAVKEEKTAEPLAAAPVKKAKAPKRVAAPKKPRVKKEKPVKVTVKKKKPAPELKEPAFELPLTPVPAPAKEEPVTPAPEPEPLVLEDMKPEPEQVKPAGLEELAASSEPQPEPEPMVLEMKPEPVKKPRVKKPEPLPEPEPLVLEEEPAPAPVPAGETVWIDHPSMEEQDLLKSGHMLGTDGIRVELDRRDTDDGQETLLVVNSRHFRIKHSLLPVNLSAMLQMARVSYGELHVHGSAGIGGLSGKGYISAPELSRIAHVLADTNERSLTQDVEYFSQDKSARTRTPGTIRVVFERAD